MVNRIDLMGLNIDFRLSVQFVRKMHAAFVSVCLIHCFA